MVKIDRLKTIRRGNLVAIAARVADLIPGVRLLKFGPGLWVSAACVGAGGILCLPWYLDRLGV